MTYPEFTGVILAGGKSSRMGQEKGLVLFHDRPLISRPIELLRRFTDKILISTAEQAYGSFGYTLVPDKASGMGPAGGLATALSVSLTDWNLVLACDMPFVDEALIHFLFSHIEGADAVIPVNSGRLEPLAALYKKSLTGTFANAVANGERALHHMLRRCNANWPDATPLLIENPRMFANLNTLSDLIEDNF